MALDISNKFYPNGRECCSDRQPCRCRLPSIPGSSAAGELSMDTSLHTALRSLPDELAPHRMAARHPLNHCWVLEQLQAAGESLLIRTPST
jgi:hypothetical protein